MSGDIMKVEIPGIDADHGLRLCDGDISIYLKFLNIFISKAPAIMGKLRVVPDDTTLKAYHINAHGLKGMCEYIGAEEARQAAKQMEIMAKEGNLAGVLAQNESFTKSIDVLIDSIRDWLKKHDFTSGSS